MIEAIQVAAMDPAMASPASSPAMQTQAQAYDVRDFAAAMDRAGGVQPQQGPSATVDIGPTHHQPLGYLHGGLSVALAESVASIGATLNAPDGSAAFGMEINANHVRPFREGVLRAVGRPLHRGQSSQVWDVQIKDDAGRLICVARCFPGNYESPGHVNKHVGW